jgi:cytoskeletal protein CcmA (bactofilin family)
MNHFDEMACLLYLEGEMESGRAREMDDHARGCGECRELLSALRQESHWLASALREEEESVPARLCAAPARTRTHWIWLVVMGLAFAGTYTLWNALIAPWREQMTRAGLTEVNLFTILVFRGAFWKGWTFMENLLEFLALGTLGMVAYGVFQRHWRRWTALAIVLGAMLCALGGATPASAAEVKHGDPDYTLGPGETINNDLLVFANIAEINGTVNGDVIGFTQDSTISGHVTGDVILFARNIRITGQVDGNVRTYSQFLVITGKVGRNVSSGCEEFQLDQGATVGGSGMVAAKDVVVSGRLGRDLMVGMGRLTINGYVGGKATVRGERLVISSSAQVDGPIFFKGQQEPDVARGARLANGVNFELQKHGPDYQSGKYYIHSLLWFGAAFVFGLALLLLAPAFFEQTIREAGSWRSVLGLLVLFSIPLIAILLGITLVGLPLGIFLLVLWIVGLYAAHIFVGGRIGEWILGPGQSFGANVGRLALGLLLVRVVKMLPYVGGGIAFIVVVWGLGAISLSAWKSIRSRTALS